MLVPLESEHLEKHIGELHLIPALTTRDNFPSHSALQQFEILTMANTVACIVRGLRLFYRCEPLPILSATTPRTLAKPGQELKMKHHIKPPHKAKGWAGTKLCCQIGFAQKSPKGAAVIWHTPGLVKHCCSCPCWFPGNKHSYKKHTHPSAQRWSSGLRPVLLGFSCCLGN